jgi:subtilisin family serine protease
VRSNPNAVRFVRRRRLVLGPAVGAIMCTPVLVAQPGAAWAAQPTTWNFTQADIPAAQPLGNYGRGVLVAVVDTWVDATQPQFGGRVVDEADCLTGTCLDHTAAPDECVHGTHVAGTIASEDYGVAPEADILAVQVLSGPPGSTPDPNAACSGSATAVAAGIRFAVDHGARIVNLSLADQIPGVFQSSAITSAVAYAAAHGVLAVFAAGNDSLPLTDSYGNDALVVAATGPSGQLASYSNYDSPLTGGVAVAAPGGDTGGSGTCQTSDCILSTFPDDELGLLEGTSMAAPHVAGLAALLWSQDPSRSLANVISTIESTASPRAGTGYGLIDAQAALAQEAATHPPAPGPAPTGPSTTPSTTQSTDGGASPTAGTAASGAVPVVDPAAGGGDRSGGVGGSAPEAAVGSTSGVDGAADSSSPTSPPGTAGSGVSAAVPASPVPVAAGPQGLPGRADPGAGRPERVWAARHAALLVLACLLLVGDVLALLWRREARRLFGGR